MLISPAMGDSSAAPSIVARGAGRRFGPVWAIRGLDLDLPAGKVTGVLGPNGAGKSTTLRLILGLIQPTEGTLEIGGRSPTGGPQTIASPLKALIDRPAFEPRFTARENLTWLSGLGPHPTSPGEIPAALEDVGLTEHADRDVRTFSTGMLQRLGIAWCLIGAPRLLVLDEPANGLDPQFRVRFREILTELKRKGQGTILISSHILGDLEGLLDHVVLIHSGKVLRQGPVSSLLAKGGRLRLRLRCQAREDMAKVLARMTDVTLIEKENDTVRIETRAGSTPELVKALVAAEVRIHEVVEESTTLEDFYVTEVNRMEETAP